MPRSATATINLSDLSRNLELVKALAPNSKVMAVIKANAYGHGLNAVAKALHSADAVAVARVHEGILLRQGGCSNRIIVLSAINDQISFEQCSEYDLEPVIHASEAHSALIDSNLERTLTVWLKIDSGMHRLGIAPETLVECYQQLLSDPNIAQVHIMSHMASADEDENPQTEQQLTLFKSLTEGLPSTKSLANSACILKYPNSHYDWVRPGIMLYGLSPLQSPSQGCSQLTPAMTLNAPVIAVRDITAGESVGYGATWTADKDTRIATIGIGYGDGYPRAASNGTPVLIDGERFSIAGRVSMDSIGVDIGNNKTIKIGDSCTLWGPKLPATEIAQHCNTIAYELITGLSGRVVYEYTD